MTSRLTEVIVDCHDLDRAADFWCAVLGYQRGKGGEGWLSVAAWAQEGGPADEQLRASAVPPVLAFVVIADPEGNEFCVMPAPDGA
jgi:catechol 2,3-dioxygenase-like lactoylglutathione lyase family enzyme